MGTHILTGAIQSAIDAFQADDDAFFQAQRSSSPVTGPSSTPAVARPAGGNHTSNIQPSQRRNPSAPTQSHSPKSMQPKKKSRQADDNASSNEDEDTRPRQQRSSAPPTQPHPPNPSQPKKKTQQANNNPSDDDDDDVQPRRRSKLIAILEGEEAEEERDDEDYDFDPDMEVCSSTSFLSSHKLTIIII